MNWVHAFNKSHLKNLMFQDTLMNKRNMSQMKSRVKSPYQMLKLFQIKMLEEMNPKELP